MVRVCANCQKSYSGGAFCPECGPGHPLIEAGSDEARAVLGPEGWAGIRAQYGARRAMLLAIAGTLLGAAVGLFVLRNSIGATQPVDRWVWIGLAVLIGATIFGGGMMRGARIARRTRRGFDPPAEDLPED